MVLFSGYVVIISMELTFVYAYSIILDENNELNTKQKTQLQNYH